MKKLLSLVAIVLCLTIAAPVTISAVYNSSSTTNLDNAALSGLGTSEADVKNNVLSVSVSGLEKYEVVNISVEKIGSTAATFVSTSSANVNVSNGVASYTFPNLENGKYKVTTTAVKSATSNSDINGHVNSSANSAFDLVRGF